VNGLLIVNPRSGRGGPRTGDGEPDVLLTPIEFRIQPRALRVLVPDGR
jgi:diacylglycerol kinase family enzyme